MDKWSETKLAAVALALGARKVPGWSEQEESLACEAPNLTSGCVKEIQARIRHGHDPLGAAFCLSRSPAERRKKGATYTPKKIIKEILSWARKQAVPYRVIDPGAGSARFLMEAGKCFKDARLIGIEIDPLAAMIARGNLAAAGLQDRAQIVVGDYREVELDSCRGKTLFVGNPPYVRHHNIEGKWKEWLATRAAECGLNASQLAGLHVYFYLATVLKGRAGDFGSFITSAEWLDVNYGRLLRELFLGNLGGRSIVVVEPTARPFPDAATTAAISTFELGSRPASIFLRRVASLEKIKKLESGRRVRRERLELERRWSHFTRGPQVKRQGYVELGELCRVHRGQVTGQNKVWIESPMSGELPDSVMFPTVTRARELFQAERILADPTALKRVIDLPVDLDIFCKKERRAIDRFLSHAEGQGTDKGYVARNRKAWWSVGLRMPAPILASYMARRPPCFVRNFAQARHINIAHGLYPREPICERRLLALIEYLSESVNVNQGRTYAGGLTKFEPREMERLLVPSPEMLDAYGTEASASMDA